MDELEQIDFNGHFKYRLLNTTFERRGQIYRRLTLPDQATGSLSYCDLSCAAKAFL